MMQENNFIKLCDVFVKLKSIRMIRPLSLVAPNKESVGLENYNISSPLVKKRADSLVFSITSEKFYSPKDTMLIESKQHEVSREIETLQLKLENLESRVQRIDSEPFHESAALPLQHNRFETKVCPRIDNDYPFGKQNKCCNTAKIGKIVKKEKDLNKTAKLNTSNQRKPKIHHFTTNSKHSLPSEESELLTKIRELSQLRREVSTMKNSIQKSQRSKSICSERLSASKDKIKDLKKEEKKHLKIIERLRADLKKSQNVRLKQKQVIQKQQEELNYYRQIFKLQKRLR